MGVSSDGIVFYGIELDYGEGSSGDNAPPWDEDPDSDGQYQWEQNADLGNCEIVLYCSYDVPMYALGIKETSVTCRRGSCKTLDHVDMWSTADDNKYELMGVLERLGLHPKVDWRTKEIAKPGWQLVSMYG